MLLPSASWAFASEEPDDDGLEVELDSSSDSELDDAGLDAAMSTGKM